MFVPEFHVHETLVSVGIWCDLRVPFYTMRVPFYTTRVRFSEHVTPRTATQKQGESRTRDVQT